MSLEESQQAAIRKRPRPERGRTVTAPSATEWYDHAACGGQNAHAFTEASAAEAKEICAGCPVRAECLYDALDGKVTNGIWGGLTYAERRQLPVLPAERSNALQALSEVLQSAARAAHAPPAPQPPKPKPKRAKTPVSRVKAPARRNPAPVPTAREDVAELLRQGRSQRQVMAELNVSHRVVAATRKAFKIPHQKGPGFRYSTQQRAENERRTLELLRAGATYQQIADEVGISQPTILAIRRKAGLPKPGPRPSPRVRSRTEALAANSEPYGDGHVRWTGSRAGRALQLNAEGRCFNARRVVFELHHGRAPVGTVRSNCQVTDCIAGAHLTDHTLRAAQQKEAPVTVQGLKNLLDEIDEQGGPQAARDNRLHLNPPAASIEPETAMPTTDPVSVVAAGLAEQLPLEQLLAWGDSHPDSSVQGQAARARAAVEGLRRRHAADQELTAITDEAAQLEKRLAELRAREAELAPKKAKRKSATGVRDYDTRTVRAWAEANGVDCPRVGQIPKRVLDGWRAAHTSSGGDA